MFIVTYIAIVKTVIVGKLLWQRKMYVSVWVYFPFSVCVCVFSF